MTAVDDRPQAQQDAVMLPETFEVLAADAAREEEGLRLEFLYGKLGVKPVPDGVHSEIIMWLQGLCMQYRPELGLYGGLGLKIETYRRGRAIPDGALAPRGQFVSAGEWAEPEGVLMTVEVTSHDRDTEQRDRVDKPRAYAESGIPVYLLIDRDHRKVTVFSKPSAGVYRHENSVAFGETVVLPEPVRIEFDTQQLLSLMASDRG